MRPPASFFRGLLRSGWVASEPVGAAWLLVFDHVSLCARQAGARGRPVPARAWLPALVEGGEPEPWR